MPGFSPVPLPSLSTLFDPTTASTAGSPAFIPSIGLVFGTTPLKVLTASPGGFALAGKSAPLRLAHKFVASAGSYALTGQGATLTKTSANEGGDAAPLPSLSTLFVLNPNIKVLFGSTGSFAISGKTATLRHGYSLRAASGVYRWIGAPALSDNVLTATKGIYAFIPKATSLIKVKTLHAAPGSFSLAGQSAFFVASTTATHTLPAVVGRFSVAGNAAALTRGGRLLKTATGSFAVTGLSADLTHVGWVGVPTSASVWTDVSRSSSTWTNA